MRHPRRNAQAKVMMPVGDRIGWAVLGEWSGEKPRTKMAATCRVEKGSIEGDNGGFKQ
ncbi:hypothetical protein DEO72_LG3g685 [Vigna unguiculata]|uniref:Uncharacterized protein n=1 Tax=Vigna unguiculata TaxID=3917 RepID=A0A4D6LD13_VIGUN|nr:hypothetical protein DEO72_LG3g685 [Vigna unguiculata]